LKLLLQEAKSSLAHNSHKPGKILLLDLTFSALHFHSSENFSVGLIEDGNVVVTANKQHALNVSDCERRVSISYTNVGDTLGIAGAAVLVGEGILRMDQCDLTRDAIRLRQKSFLVRDSLVARQKKCFLACKKAIYTSTEKKFIVVFTLHCFSKFRKVDEIPEGVLTLLTAFTHNVVTRNVREDKFMMNGKNELKCKWTTTVAAIS
jgi:hypothetical protein